MPIQTKRETVYGRQGAKSIPVTSLRNNQEYVLDRPGKAYDKTGGNQGTVFKHNSAAPFHTTKGLKAFVVERQGSRLTPYVA